MREMTRSALLVLALAACGGSSRHVAKHAAPGDGICREAGGCETPIEDQTRYEPPDAEHPLTTGGITDPSCSDVATSLAALDLGNYADDDQLRPLVAKYKASCVRAKLDKSERECVFEATDRPTVTWCAPRMMPGAAVAVVAARDCPDAIKQLREQAAQYQPQAQPILEKQIAAVQTSCEQDRWTLAFRDCVRAVPYPGYLTTYCGGAAPAPLRRKINDRLAQVK
jgi:hypothetical protein